MSRKKGPLVIIGGSEERGEEHDREILKRIARGVAHPKGRLLIVTVATMHPEEVAADYTREFRSLGVKHLGVLDIRTRDQAHDPAVIKSLDHATAIFFTGGDQVRITSQI